jgi:hypothetical protein
MLTVTVSIPQINGAGAPYPLPKLYAWFAYFWTDQKTLNSSGPTPIAVNVPASGNTRAEFLNTPGEDSTGVPADLGSFSVKLDDSIGSASFGAIVLVLGQYDTPDDAIASGYSAFRTSITTELNKLVPSLVGGGSPDPQQISALNSAVSNGVISAIKGSLGAWDKFLSVFKQEKADVFLGSSYVYFNQTELTPQGGDVPHSKIDAPLQLPPTPDHIFTFPSATITVIPGNQVVPDCSVQEKTLALAQAALAKLEAELRAAKAEKPTSAVALRAVENEISKLENISIPGAQESVSQAERALHLCRSRPPAALAL